MKLSLRAQIAAQIMAALVAQRDRMTALQRAFDPPPATAKEHFAIIAADAVAAADALIAALETNEPINRN